MGILRNLPKILGVARTITPYKKHGKAMDDAHYSGNYELEKKLIGDACFEWVQTVSKKLALEFDVRGRENLPEEDGFVIVANHQGYADILTLLYAMHGRQLGFVAKDDLKKVPLIGKWAVRLRSVFIDRSSAKAGMKSIKDGAELVKNGFNLAIFPEGHRSRGGEMREFKAGSFRLATMAKAPIVPISINGSYHMYEETGVLRPAKIKCVIHPPIQTEGLSRKALAEMEAAVYKTIRAGL